MITIISNNFIMEEKKEEFLALAKKMVKKSRQEDGCISYTLQENIENPLHFCFIEQWQDTSAIAKHNNTPHFQEIVPKIRQCRQKQLPAYRFRTID